MKLKGVTIDGVNYFVSEEQIKEHGSQKKAAEAAKAAKEKSKKPQKETEK